MQSSTVTLAVVPGDTVNLSSFIKDKARKILHSFNRRRLLSPTVSIFCLKVSRRVLDYNRNDPQRMNSSDIQMPFDTA